MVVETENVSKKVFCLENINENVLNTRGFSIRGPIYARAIEIEKALKGVKVVFFIGWVLTKSQNLI
jgi:hypothetical protein